MNIELDQIQAACKQSLHFLCTNMLGFSHWDGVHDDIEVFLNRKARKKLCLVPRGHLKTSIVTKAFAIQCLLKNPNARILIANQVWDKAREMLYEIKQQLTTKSDLPKIFGSFESERWREDDIVIRQRGRALAAPSIGTSGVEAELTSSHYDIILLDDLQGLQNCISKEQRDKVKRYYRSMIDLLEPGGLLIVVGTRWHMDDLYAEIMEKESAYFDIMIRKIVEKGKIIFPKKFNKRFDPVAKDWIYTDRPCMDYITALKASKEPGEFSAQYMNQPIDEENQLFKPTYFKTYDRRPERLYVSMTIDPAISEKQSADYFAINVSGMDENHNIYILDSLKGRWRTSEQIDNIFTTYLKWKPSVIGLETVAYQKALKFWLEEKMRERGVHFPITELKRGNNQTKEFRIKALEPYYREGKVFHASWMKTLEEELLAFPKGRHDDEIDALASQLDLLLPGDAQAAELPNPGTWQAAYDAARYANQPYKDFFHETVRF